MNVFRVCYVMDGWAYFTSQVPTVQTGLYWFERPYEIHAGRPWSGDDYEIVIHSFLNNERGSLLEPKDISISQTSLSVNDINQGKIPWLIDYLSGDRLPLHATEEEFIQFVKRAGGKVFSQI